MEDAHIATADVDLPGGFIGAKAAKGGDDIHPPDKGYGGGEEKEADKSDEDKEQGGAMEEGEGGPNDEASAAGNHSPAATAVATVVPDRARVFAVFDGHGGPEVARFCQLYLVDVLTKTEGWRGPNVDIGEAGVGKGDDISGCEEIENEAKEEGKKSGVPEDQLNRRIGEALVDCFHAVDRMIDDPSRREEIALLRVEKPRLGETRSVSAQKSHTVEYSAGSSSSQSFPVMAMPSGGTGATATSTQPELEKKEDDKEEGSDEDEEGRVTADGKLRPSGNYDNGDRNKQDEANYDLQDEGSPAGKERDDVMKEAERTGGNSHNGQLQDSDEDDDESKDNTKKDECDLVDDANKDDQENNQGGMSVSAADAVSLFRKLLTGQARTAGEAQNGDVNPSNNQGGGTSATGQMMGPSVTQPTRIQNGRQVNQGAPLLGCFILSCIGELEWRFVCCGTAIFSSVAKTLPFH